MKAAPRIAVIGAGPMGSNHARVIAESDDAQLAAVVDIDSERARVLGERLGCPYAGDLDGAGRFDGAVVATPTARHCLHAGALLELGIPVLVEKPVAPTLETSRALLALSERTGTPIMCGFVERFSPAVTTVLSLLDAAPVHIVALRHSPPTPRSKLTVVFDLLIHDIDLALRYMHSHDAPRVSSSRAALGGDIAEVADCMLAFGSGALATLSASRASQRKVRTQLIETEGALFDVDLLRQDVTVYRHRNHEAAFDRSLTYRAETVVDIPFVRHSGEPLALQLRHFVALIDGSVDAEAERRSILPAHEIAASVEAAA